MYNLSWGFPPAVSESSVCARPLSQSREQSEGRHAESTGTAVRLGRLRSRASIKMSLSSQTTAKHCASRSLSTCFTPPVRRPRDRRSTFISATVKNFKNSTWSALAATFRASRSPRHCLLPPVCKPRDRSSTLNSSSVMDITYLTDRKGSTSGVVGVAALVAALGA